MKHTQMLEITILLWLDNCKLCQHIRLGIFLLDLSVTVNKLAELIDNISINYRREKRAILVIICKKDQIKGQKLADKQKVYASISACKL